MVSKVQRHSHHIMCRDHDAPEEGVGVGQAAGRNGGRVSAGAISPVLAQVALPRALHDEEHICHKHATFSEAGALRSGAGYRQQKRVS